MMPATANKAAARGDFPFALRFGVESQNVLNHVNRGLPIGVLNSPFFGRSISLASIYTDNQAANRVVTLSTAFSF
jgi:flagellar biosynthesis/type III secretory pathway ATPase